MGKRWWGGSWQSLSSLPITMETHNKKSNTSWHLHTFFPQAKIPVIKILLTPLPSDTSHFITPVQFNCNCTWSNCTITLIRHRNIYITPVLSEIIHILNKILSSCTNILDLILALYWTALKCFVLYWTALYCIVLSVYTQYMTPAPFISPPG